jgi:hypothetical protein
MVFSGDYCQQRKSHELVKDTLDASTTFGDVALDPPCKHDIRITLHKNLRNIAQHASGQVG